MLPTQLSSFSRCEFSASRKVNQLSANFDYDKTFRRSGLPIHTQEHKDLGKLLASNPFIKPNIITGLSTSELRQSFEGYIPETGDAFIPQGVYTGSGTRFYPNPKKLTLPEYVDKVIIPNRFDTNYSDWPTEALSESLKKHFKKIGTEISFEQLPTQHPFHNNGEFYQLSSSTPNKGYYVRVGNDQESFTIIPYLNKSSILPSGEDSERLLKESTQEIRALVKKATNAAKKDHQRRDYLVHAYAFHSPNDLYAIHCDLKQQGTTKGKTVAKIVGGDNYEGVIVGVDSHNDETMATPKHYKNKQGIPLLNNVLHMASPHMQKEVEEWRKQNPNIVLVEDTRYPLPSHLKVDEQPTTLRKGIEWTLRKMGMRYKE